MKSLSRLPRSASLLLFIATLAAAQSAHAADIIVTTADDELDATASDGDGISLREAIRDIGSGDTITFDPSLSGSTTTLGDNPGTGTNGSGELSIGISLTIDASALTDGLTIDANSVSRVMAITSGGYTVTLNNLTLSNGFTNFGGAIDNDSGTLTLNNVTLYNNSADGDGGAIYNFNGILTLNNTTLYDNSSPFAGGGILNDEGTITLNNTTLCSNSADLGGGIANYVGTLTLNNATLYNNSASDVGGGILNEDASLTLNNSIVAGNTAANTGSDIEHISGTGTPTGINLIGDTTDSGLSVGANVIDGAPLLAPLGFYGGHTKTTPPLVGSPAIDAGGATALITDQRGYARSIDGNSDAAATPDIGAVEAGAAIIVTNNADTGAGSLRQAITDATSSGYRILFTGLANTTVTLTTGELDISSTQNIFIDASNIPGGVTIDGGNSSRLFDLATNAIMAAHSLHITNGSTIGSDGNDGGGLRNLGTTTLIESTLTNNSADFHGGAINNTGQLALLDCTLSDNIAGASAATDGGALHTNSAGATSQIARCTFARNMTGRNGGAIAFTDDTTNTVTNSTFANNNAGNHGGAIFNSGTLSLIHSTVSDNQADSDDTGGGYGGGIRNNSGTLAIETSILAGNTTGSATPDDYTTDNNASTSTASTGISIIETPLNATTTATLTGSITILNSDPLLAPLGYYGGHTQTMPPFTGSPAIDPGGATTLTTDQRGSSRTIDGDSNTTAIPDIGAVEFQGATDLAIFWDLDWDGDGNPFGIEFACGTNPFSADLDHADNLSAPVFNVGGFPELSFGINIDAKPYTIWILKRSTDLVTDTFTAVYTFDGPSDITSDASIVIEDQSPPEGGKAFYRLEAHIAP